MSSFFSLVMRMLILILMPIKVVALPPEQIFLVLISVAILSWLVLLSLSAYRTGIVVM